MALERINPFIREDRFCLDHLLRYYWASALAASHTVLDAACGTGFGSELLARSGATRVTGIDISDEVVDACKANWSLPNLDFTTGSLEDLSSALDDTFGRVVCFETLEHVEHPDRAISSIKSVLDPDGLLIGSVPGEMDRLEENEYHLQQFTRDRLQHLLLASFSNVVVMEQNFHLSSRISVPDSTATSPVDRQSADLLNFDFGKGDPWADSFVFLASDGELPAVPDLSLGLSRTAWTEYHRDSLAAHRQLKATSLDYMRFYALYNTLFAENGDLQKRFENLLHWGQYHYEKATGKEPDEHYMQSIEKAQSRREKALEEQVLALQQKVQDLKNQVREAQAAGKPVADSARGEKGVS